MFKSITEKDKVLIRTSRHDFPVKEMNTNRLLLFPLLREEYGKALVWFIDYLWNNRIEWESTNKKSGEVKHFVFDLYEDSLDCPSMISTVGLKINEESSLSSRVLKSVATQACGIVGAVVEIKRKRKWVREKLSSEGKDTKNIDKRIKEMKFTKPKVGELNMELNSICCDFSETSKKFAGYIKLKSLWSKEYKKELIEKNINPEIKIPIQHHKQSKKWKKQGKMLTSFLVGSHWINFRWEVPKPEIKNEGKSIGVDQGKTTCVTLSDGQVSTKTKQGFDLSYVCDLVARKKKGTRAFRKATEYRKNIINWSINQLELNDIKELKFENVININYGRRVSRKMAAWASTLIRDKTERFCEENGVSFTLQSSPYRSQRCSDPSCGWVEKKNRNGKLFCCRKCGHTDDADFNASKNHEADLPEIRFPLSGLSKIGFYWRESGLFDEYGVELQTVPLVPSINEINKNI